MSTGLESTLRGIIRSAAPIVIAGQGELITERAGVINLALDGTIMLSAMTAHVVVRETGSLPQAILAAMLVGAAVVFVVVTSSIALRLNQVAVGFVLTILCADLAIFLGKPHFNRPGKEIPTMPIPLLEDIPFLGPVLFRHNLLIYFSLILTLLVWFYIYRTRPGLTLRSIGEQPEAAFVRGTPVNRLRYVYALLGGALVGLAGATYSLSVKLGWKEDLSGEGWIALAIVIFGLWVPSRVALGAYLIVGLRSIAIDLQDSDVIDLPAQIVNMLPWFLMILTLLFATSGALQKVVRYAPDRFKPAVRRFLRAAPPRALGTTFEKH
jgi:general nucleoside transport system permease protein